MNHRQAVSFMAQAYMLAGLSYAKDRKVGAYLLKEHEDGTQQIISVGYNGTRPGEDNATEIDGVTKPNVRHAERNAIVKANKSTISTDGSALFVTTSPCEDCADLIMGIGVRRVYFCETFDKCPEPLDELRSNGIEVLHIDMAEVLDFIDERQRFMRQSYNDRVYSVEWVDNEGNVFYSKATDYKVVGAPFRDPCYASAKVMCAAHVQVTAEFLGDAPETVASINGKQVIRYEKVGQSTYKLLVSADGE